MQETSKYPIWIESIDLRFRSKQHEHKGEIEKGIIDDSSVYRLRELFIKRIKRVENEKEAIERR